MQNFMDTFNAVALDATLVALFGEGGRDRARQVYEQLNTLVTDAFESGRNDGVAAGRVEGFEQALETSGVEAAAYRTGQNEGYRQGFIDGRSVNATFVDVQHDSGDEQPERIFSPHTAAVTEEATREDDGA